MAKLSNIFFDVYLNDLIGLFYLDGKKSSARIYSGALKWLRQCFGDDPIKLSDIDCEWVLKFRSYLINSGLGVNSINTYLSVTRNVYNRVIVTYRIRRVCHPFEKAFLLIKQSSQETSNTELIERVRLAPIGHRYELCFSRDLFLFSYYSGGLSFRYMAMLKKENVTNNELHFKHSRDRTINRARLTEQSMAIMAAYSGFGDYLFPIIENPEKDFHKQYRIAFRMYTVHLLELAQLLELQGTLSIPMKPCSNRNSLMVSRADIESNVES